MGVDIRAWGAFALDFRHVACDALAAWTTILVVGVLLDGGSARAVGGCGAMAIHAELICGLS